MTRGTLYGLGVGPGDPELLTLKAVRLLREADVVAVPNRGGGEGTALHIVKDYVQDKPLLLCATPMVRDRQILDSAHDRIAGDICALLEEGKRVVFITLGDPTVYSTYLYIHRRVREFRKTKPLLTLDFWDRPSPSATAPQAELLEGGAL